MHACKNAPKGPKYKDVKERLCVKLANNQVSQFPVYGGSFQLEAKTASVSSVEHGVLKKIRGKELPELPEVGFAN